jgi:hypothetical protein
MSKETDIFLSNECMKALMQLSSKNPNDMDFGRAVRSFIHDSNQPIDNSQIKIPYNQVDMGDVNEH